MKLERPGCPDLPARAELSCVPGIWCAMLPVCWRNKEQRDAQQRDDAKRLRDQASV